MTQLEQIQKHLKEGNEINPLMALERFGCMRLAARIADLRSMGMRIETLTKKSNGKVYAAYRLEGE
jgi:hypothetical protein